jgi:transposase
VVFVDESAFYLLPSVVRTYAPRGQTPILKTPCRYEHLSVISGVTPDGRLFTWIQDHAFNGASIVRFLKHLYRWIRGPILLVWDGLPAHRGQVVKRFLAEGGAAHFHLERLPAYAPDLNPDEGVWRYLKRVELANVCCHSLMELRDQVRQAIARLRAKPHIIQSFFKQAGVVF